LGGGGNTDSDGNNDNILKNVLPFKGWYKWLLPHVIREKEERGANQGHMREEKGDDDAGHFWE
jgi:hypothetical protein